MQSDAFKILPDVLFIALKYKCHVVNTECVVNIFVHILLDYSDVCVCSLQDLAPLIVHD